jgi:hypothetical protein
VSNESPIRYGFRTIWREPSLALAEIAWRWSWGAATLLFAWFAGHEFLRSLTVSHRDEWQLQSGSPQLIADAILHIFQGSGPTVLRLFLIVAPASVLLWVIAATLGRTVTLRSLVAGDARFTGRSLSLHLWRAVIGALSFGGTVLSFLAAALLMARTEPPQPLVFLAVFFPLTLLFTFVRSRINWLLLLGNIYAARGMKAGEGFGQATVVFRRRSGEFMGVGGVAGALRIVLIGVVTFLDLALVPFAGEAPSWLLWALFAVITLAYFAVSDWLYMVKLAAYARIIEEDARPAEAPAAVAAAPRIPPAPVAPIPSVPAR